MELREKVNHVETSNMENSKNFQLKVNGKAFDMLSNGIYSDKITAVVRELSCNAIDSNKESKNPDPIEIHAPSILEPYFSVKDNGLGLSHEDVLNLYTTYFESTKNNSNESIGAFGLGSKSPFAYTSNFTITSRFNNVKRTYIAFLESNNVPSCSFVGEENTQERNGVEVSLSIKNKDDIEDFKNAIRNSLSRFNPIPSITNMEQINKIEYILSGNDWGFRKNSVSASKAFAIQGGVAYPIEFRKLNNMRINISNIDLFFNIGDLDVAVSREHLSYDKQTINTIEEKIKSVKKEINNKVTEEINKCDTFFNACKKYYEICEKIPFVSFEKIYYQNDRRVIKFISLETKHFKNVSVKVFPLHYKNRCSKNVQSLTDVELDTLIFIDDNVHAPQKKLSDYLCDNNINEKAILLKNISKDDVNDLDNQMPGIKYTYLSELSLPNSKSSKSNRQRSRECRLYYARNFFSSSRLSNFNDLSWAETSYNFSDFKGVYVLISKWQPILSNNLKYNKNVTKLLSLGYIPENTEIYGIFPKYEETAFENGWISLDELVRKNIEKNKKQILNAYNYMKLSMHLKNYMDKIPSNSIINKDSKFLKYKNEVELLYNDYKITNIHLLEYFGDVEKPNSKVYLEIENNLFEKYPMLKHAINYVINNNMKKDIIDYINLIDNNTKE